MNAGKAISNQPSVLSKNTLTTDGCVLTADSLGTEVKTLDFNTSEGAAGKGSQQRQTDKDPGTKNGCQ